MTSKLLEICGLKKYFPIRRGLLRRPAGYIRAVDDVSFFVRQRETLGVVGESGCGKTTMARCVLRLIEPTEGSISYWNRAHCDILLIPLNVTTKVKLTPVHLQQLRSSRNPAGDILASMAEYWWELQKTSSSPMHDPLAVAAVFQPELLQVAPGKVAVTCEAGSDGQTRFFPDNDARTQIAVGVDAEAFLKLLLERICP